MLVMKKEKLNLRKFCLFSPAGTDLKQMIGRRIKFQIMQTTQAFVIVTSRIDDPINAKADARRMRLFVKATQAMNSSPARDVSNNQDHPVNEIGKARREPNFILPNITTETPQTEMIKSMAVPLGIPIICASSSSSAKRTTGGNSSGLGLSWKIAV